MTKEDFELFAYEEKQKLLEEVIEKNKIIAALEERVAFLQEDGGIKSRDIVDLKERLVKSNKWAMRMQKKLKEMGVEDDE